MSIFENVEVQKNELFTVRLLEVNDTKDLLLVYSDKKAFPLFDSVNCNDNFFYDTMEKMEKAMSFWLDCYYKWKAFVRLAIVDNKSKKAVGTFEVFKKDDLSCFMRVDIRSDFEEKGKLISLLNLVKDYFMDAFDAKRIIIKGAESKERMDAFRELGFIFDESIAVTDKNNGNIVKDYYVLCR